LLHNYHTRKQLVGTLVAVSNQGKIMMINSPLKLEFPFTLVIYTIKSKMRKH